MLTNSFVLQDKEYCMIIYSKKHRILNYENKKIIFKNSMGSSYKKTEHPTEKPLNIFSYLIQKYNKENDLIFDPFMGSDNRVCLWTIKPKMTRLWNK